VAAVNEMMMRVTINREHQAASVADRQSACQRAPRARIPSRLTDGCRRVDELTTGVVESDPIPLIDMT
jgi:hypothetical protein